MVDKGYCVATDDHSARGTLIIVDDRVSMRELRNNISEILRRVESGDRLRVTRNRRPVADLIPLPRRQEGMRWAELSEVLGSIQADAELAGDLSAALPGTTDEL